MDIDEAVIYVFDVTKSDVADTLQLRDVEKAIGDGVKMVVVIE